MSAEPQFIVVNGHTIALNADFRFLVTGPMFEGETTGNSTFDSVFQAKQEIAGRLEAHAKQARAANSLRLTVYDAAGKQATIHGVHISRGSLLGVDEVGPAAPGTGRDGDAYPFVPWLADLLKERIVVVERLSAIQRKLRFYAIRRNRTHTRIRAVDYDRVIAELETEYAEKTEKAQGAMTEAQQAVAPLR